jgi:hypothetical protein
MFIIILELCKLEIIGLQAIFEEVPLKEINETALFGAFFLVQLVIIAL